MKKIAASINYNFLRKTGGWWGTSTKSRERSGVRCSVIPNINDCTIYLRYVELYGEGAPLSPDEYIEMEKQYSCPTQKDLYECGDLLDEYKKDQMQRLNLSNKQMK